LAATDTLAVPVTVPVTGGAVTLPEGMSRRTVDLPEEPSALLDTAKRQDGIGAAARIRAMVRVWVEDPVVRARVDALAAQSHAEWTRRLQANAAKARSARWRRSD